MNLNTEIIAWGWQYLSSHGYKLESSLPEEVQITPWSYVLRFATSGGYIYLKHIPALLALEAPILQILHDQLKISVPEVIVHNAELNCFLMKDAGKPLRVLLKKQFDLALICKAIDQFTRMQVTVSDHISTFLDMGVPDWRLDKLPGLFEALLSHQEVLIADGISELEKSELKALLPTLYYLCEKLSRYAIKQTLVQPDFHDNNLLIGDKQNITIIDLGEIVISHPFFSLVNCLQQIKKHHGLIETDNAYQELLDTCFKNFKPYESKINLLEAFALARLLLPIYGALAHYRLMLACGKDKLMLFQGQGKLSGQLKAFITACKSHNINDNK